MASDFIVTELLDINPNEGIINFRGSRMLLFRADALFRLREELVRNLGENMARNIMTRFGYRCGAFDVMASREFFSFENDADWMLAGPKMHALEGMVQATCDHLKFDRESGSFLMRGAWKNSYEAENYLRKYGRSKEPVCWTLTGYASGFGTGFMGRQVVCVETMCQGMGDPCCRYEMRSIEDWNGQAARNVRDLQRNVVLKNFQTLLEEERERVYSWQLLNRAIIDISTSLSSSSMPVKTVEHAQKILRADRAVMAVVTEKKKRILLYETAGWKKVNTRVLTEPCGVTTSILEGRKPLERPGGAAAIQGLGADAQSLLGIPLFFKKEPIAALIVINKAGGGVFSQHDREILDFLGAHSAVAIGNARVYEQTNQKLQENIAELYRVNSLLMSEHDALQKSTHIHNRLTSLVLEGHGLEEIGRNLAAILARPVVIADQYFHILSSSRSGDGAPDIRQIWQEVIRGINFREGLSSLLSEKRLITLSTGDEHRLAVASVVAGSDNLGFVAAVEGGRPLSQMDCMAMEHAGTVIALDLLKQKATFETERRLKKDFLEELLGGNYENEEAVIRRAEKLGLDLAGTYRVLAIDLIPGSAASAAEGRGDRKSRPESFFQALDRAVKQVSPDIAIIGRKANIIGIINAGNVREKGVAGRLQAVNRGLEAVLNRIFPEHTWWAGISSSGSGVSGFAGLYREVCTTIDIIKSLNCSNRCQAYESLGIFGLLNINVDQFKKFVHHVIGPILKYDEKHNSQLLQTLHLYFTNNCNLQKAARRGFMNASTMKYRLRRIAEIARINISDPETNLQVQLALKIIEGLK